MIPDDTGAGVLWSNDPGEVRELSALGALTWEGREADPRGLAMSGLLAAAITAKVAQNTDVQIALRETGNCTLNLSPDILSPPGCAGARNAGGPDD